MPTTHLSRFWSPPPDPERPLLPYVKGLSVTIAEHVAPPPFGGGQEMYPEPKIPYDTSDKFLKTVTRTELVVTCPPIESTTKGPIPKSPAKATLKFTSAIAVKDGRGPQLVLCSICPEGKDRSSFSAVAKIFDPLYYSFADKDAPSLPACTPLEADEDYSIEAAAYAQLKKTGHTGALAPEYYGSWTFKLPIRHAGVDRERHVRVLLIEHIKGVCMRDFCYGNSTPNFIEEHRLDVLARVLDGYVKVQHSGVDQDDCLPRNIMLVTRPEGNGSPLVVQRIVLIDYNVATILHLSPEAQQYHQVTKLPRNPMDIFWNATLHDFGHWVPREWRKPGLKAQQQWLLGRFGGAAAPAYAPAYRMPKFND